AGSSVVTVVVGGTRTGVAAGRDWHPVVSTAINATPIAIGYHRAVRRRYMTSDATAGDEPAPTRLTGAPVPASARERARQGPCETSDGVGARWPGGGGA